MEMGWGCRWYRDTGRDVMGMAKGEGGGRMETEIGQGCGGDQMEVGWEEHKDH